jgi:anaerobic ribonucleoside-triphosphate reductase activating protein
LRVLGYLPNSIVDGVGIRQVFFLSGCPHHCKGCHNPQSWNPDNGDWVTVKEIVTKALSSPYDVTFSGGDPLHQLTELNAVMSLIKPKKGIWVYTGYTWEEIMENEALKSVLEHIDVLVDGRFEEDKRNPELVFRGSENQRIIDVQKSLQANEVVLWEVCQ